MALGQTVRDSKTLQETVRESKQTWKTVRDMQQLHDTGRDSKQPWERVRDMQQLHETRRDSEIHAATPWDIRDSEREP